MNNKIQFLIIGVITLLAIYFGWSLAVQGYEKHHGKMHGSMSHHHEHDEVNMPMLNGIDTEDYEVEELRQLFNNHSDIIRSVEILPNGIKTITETKNEELLGFLVGHASGMINRVEEKRDPGIPIQSPTLTPLFNKGNLIETNIEYTDYGLIVIQTSNDQEVIDALHKHAIEVSDLAARGMVAVHEQMMSSHH